MQFKRVIVKILLYLILFSIKKKNNVKQYLSFNNCYNMKFWLSHNTGKAYLNLIMKD